MATYIYFVVSKPLVQAKQGHGERKTQKKGFPIKLDAVPGRCEKTNSFDRLTLFRFQSQFKYPVLFPGCEGCCGARWGPPWHRGPD